MAEKPSQGVYLNWSDRKHWGRWPKPCRWCRVSTMLLDEYGQPSHKVCAEDAIRKGLRT